MSGLGVFLRAGAPCGCPPSALWYLTVLGSVPGSVPDPGPAAAAAHSFSSSPSSSHVCAASEWPRSSETHSEGKIEETKTVVRNQVHFSFST